MNRETGWTGKHGTFYAIAINTRKKGGKTVYRVTETAHVRWYAGMPSSPSAVFSEDYTDSAQGERRYNEVVAWRRNSAGLPDWVK
ncbi:hypothetical protein ABZ905_36765 [Streptomyces parvus]|uniref:hypothetical protein n=1 Tax=Streptomyces parvus TaxID=66428 RepID=UPI0033C4128C